MFIFKFQHIFGNLLLHSQNDWSIIRLICGTFLLKLCEKLARSKIAMISDCSDVFLVLWLSCGKFASRFVVVTYFFLLIQKKTDAAM